MKKIILLFIVTCFSLSLFAQQEEQYTQFMYYKLGLNPAYAGKDGAPSLSALARNQWIGIDGAPQTQLLTFNTPVLNNRAGVGTTLARQTIGVTENYTLDGNYAYHLRLGRGYLGIGIQASLRLLRVNFSELQGTQPTETDGAIPVGYQSRYVPNFGAGLYYSGKNTYFGISVPRLLATNIDLASSDNNNETQHLYLMGGVKFNLSEKVQIQPQILLKYVQGAPFDGDVNVSFVFSEKFTTGISYRLGGSKVSSIGESVSLLLATQITKELMFGLSYDMTLSELKKYNSGSVEAVVRYFFGGKEQEGGFVNPRFF